MAKARGKRSRVMGVAMALGLGAAGCRSAPVNVPPGDDPRDGLGSAARAPAIDAAHAAPPAPPPDATPAPTFDAPPPIELRALADLPRATWKATPVEPGLARAVSACGLPFGKLQRASADGPACRPPLTDAGGDALQACVDTANQAAVTSATERLLRREGATNLGEVDVFVCMDPAAASTSVTTPVCTPDMLRVDDDFESGWWLRGADGSVRVVQTRVYEASRRQTMICACSGCCGTMPMEEFGPPDPASRPIAYQVLRTPHGVPTGVLDLLVPSHVEQLDRSDTIDGKRCPAVP